MRPLREPLAAAAFFGLVSAQPAAAHPHILIDAHAFVRFNPQGEAVSLSNVWTFDPAFSAYAIQGYDSKGDGRPTKKELQPLANVNIRSLAVYHFFTRIFIDKTPVAFAAPLAASDEFSNEALTLQFTLPLKSPANVKGKNFEVDVYDPDYFAAIKFAPREPITLVGASGCSIAIHRPAPLEAGVASQLAAIPADQRELPTDLFNVTSKLINGATILCR